MKYKEPEKNAAFLNACDCLKFGFGTKHWNTCGLNKEEAEEVWKAAILYLSNL